MYISGNDVSGRGSRLHPHIYLSIHSILPPWSPTMEAFRLRKKFPEVSNDEMLDLINRFKYVHTFGGAEHDGIFLIAHPSVVPYRPTRPGASTSSACFSHYRQAESRTIKHGRC